MTQEQIAYNNDYIHQLAFKELNRLTEGRLQEKEMVHQKVKCQGFRKCTKCGEWMLIKDIKKKNNKIYCEKCIHTVKFR